jgi:twitching motility protein PilJ
VKLGELLPGRASQRPVKASGAPAADSVFAPGDTELLQPLPGFGDRFADSVLDVFEPDCEPHLPPGYTAAAVAAPRPGAGARGAQAPGARRPAAAPGAIAASASAPAAAADPGATRAAAPPAVGSGGGAGARTQRPSRNKKAADRSAAPAGSATLETGSRRAIRAMPALLLLGVVGAFFFGWLHARGGGLGPMTDAHGHDVVAESQRLARLAPRAVAGDADAFPALRDARDALRRSLDAALSPAAPLAPADRGIGQLRALGKTVDEASAGVLALEGALREAGVLRQRLETVSATMIGDAETVVQRKMGVGTNPGELVQAGRLPPLAHRLPRELDLLLRGDPAAAQAAGATLAADLAQLREAAGALLAGSERLRIPATTDARGREALERLVATAASLADPVQAVAGALPAIREARLAAARLEAAAEPLRDAARAAGVGVVTTTADARWALWPAIGCVVLAVLAAIALMRAQARDNQLHRERIDRQLREAERLEHDAKRANDQNQAAILRLMNELQSVADGDLTVQATVSEDITGAIADSVNYTVEELRSLVSRINTTAEMVNAASSQAQMIASSLQAASEEQSREIRETGESVLRMAQQINEVSARATDSARVARQSLSASHDGAHAVHTAIEGMDAIRGHIQETAKRIKRLGESSQEIGEIVELISDITEQTNVLALNAAIQAASAGEAGRGFTVVAEEVQRLAERSAAATRQIASLIRTIQTDTQNAVAAMERSTQGVVEGTRQSDDAGRALDEIGRFSSRVAELIEEFSNSTSRQAASAGIVAQSIQRILIVTEQTSEGTLQTAGSIRQLAELSQELQNSVSRFKVA